MLQDSYMVVDITVFQEIDQKLYGTEFKEINQKLNGTQRETYGSHSICKYLQPFSDPSPAHGPGSGLSAPSSDPPLLYQPADAWPQLLYLLPPNGRVLRGGRGPGLSQSLERGLA